MLANLTNVLMLDQHGYWLDLNVFIIFTGSSKSSEWWKRLNVIGFYPKWENKQNLSPKTWWIAKKKMFKQNSDWFSIDNDFYAGHSFNERAINLKISVMFRNDHIFKYVDAHQMFRHAGMIIVMICAIYVHRNAVSIALNNRLILVASFLFSTPANHFDMFYVR